MFGLWYTKKRQIQDLRYAVSRLEEKLRAAEYRAGLTTKVADEASSRTSALARYLKVRFETVPAQSSRLQAVSAADEDRAVEEQRFVPHALAETEELRKDLREAQDNLLKAADTWRQRG